MHPIFGCNASLYQVFSIQDGLTSQRNHHRMVNVMVQSIRVGDVFKGKVPAPDYDVSKLRLLVTRLRFNMAKITSFGAKSTLRF
jgi:hypothetical protein